MESNVRDLDLNEIIDEVVCMMEKEAFYNGITIERTYDKSLPTLCSDPAHLRQMFVNLLKNAFDAVEKNGRVTIGTRKAGGNTVSITVADSGCGISKEHIDKVFDPFFTTKPPGKGTGLGLSICYGIATILGGSISVESIVNQGATFTVTLPLKPPENIKVRTGDLD
jgi:two-component system NtrC family sensor kinase